MTNHTRSVLRTALRALVAPCHESDAALLERFLADRAEEAFHAIVQRHGGLVLDVCQSVLRNEADAEDAFQATFLTLATRAESVRTPAALAAWLHGTAYRTARKARVLAARRRAVEARIPPKDSVSSPDPSWAEVREAIHREVNRLPERERAAAVLCYLGGLTQDDAGAALGLSREGVKKRLERSRDMLRIALARRGFGPAGVLAVSILPPSAAPVVLVTGTASLALEASLGTLRPEVLPVGIRCLLEGSVNLVSTTRVLVALAGLALVSAAGFGMAGTNDPTPHRPVASPQASTAGNEARSAEPRHSELDGTWRLVKLAEKGKEVTAVPGIEFTFRDGKLELSPRPGRPEQRAPLPDFLSGALVHLNPKAMPRTIDFTPDAIANKKVPLPGIYQIRGEQLKIALRTPTTASLPRPKGYSTVSGTLITITLQRLPIPQQQFPGQ